MLDTKIDSGVLLDLFSNKPKSLLEGGTNEENLLFHSILDLLKLKTNLQIGCFNQNLPFNNYINILTSGRGESKLLEPLSNSVLSDIPNVDENVHSTYFSEIEDEKCKILQNECGLMLSNIKDYKVNICKLLNWDKPDKLPVRISESKSLKCWEEICPFLLPTTDIIIYDNFILGADDDTIESNLFKMIEVLAKSSAVKFNLLIIYKILFDKQTKKTFPKLIENEKAIKNFIEENKINCNLGLIETDNEFKEHDRGIFMNYLRIYSGDSFNYFKQSGEIITKTDIQFQYYSDPTNYIVSNAALKSINNIVIKCSNTKKLFPTFTGDIKNRLLETL